MGGGGRWEGRMSTPVTALILGGAKYISQHRFIMLLNALSILRSNLFFRLIHFYANHRYALSAGNW